ncbi:MAG: YoaK family protein [Terriglobales bacterium]
MPEEAISLAPPRQPLHTWGRAMVVLALAWIAGYVDAVGYMALLAVYTSHMTGNTAALGRYFAIKDWHLALLHAWPLLAFVIGLMGGAMLTELGRRRGYHSRLSLVMIVEIILLAVLAHADRQQAASTSWLGLPAIAMGMQTVTVTRVGEQRVYSTYITGSLSKFGEALTGYGFWVVDRWRARRGATEVKRSWLRHNQRNKLLQHTLLNLGLWGLFLAGAMSGANVEGVKGLSALWWPILGLALLVVLDWWHPIAPVREGEPLAFET